MRISDWSSDVCSSDLWMTADVNQTLGGLSNSALRLNMLWQDSDVPGRDHVSNQRLGLAASLGLGLETATRSEEHTSELQSLMRISYAVFCLKKKTKKNKTPHLQLNNTRQHHNITL